MTCSEIFGALKKVGQGVVVWTTSSRSERVPAGMLDREYQQSRSSPRGDVKLSNSRPGQERGRVIDRIMKMCF
jgi:hypothetical protein